ncbi:gamma-glutamyltransferase family protein [Mangrovicella endophytica]|uniref:gamma-glutamyltransferase family protein n=1 Tax=Mangrovicella endophytica TaxID=2066697 RepID=UPI000C9E6F89|nr:gamma-glutamyltransferase [Mangrovicella endophytica]
MVTSPHRLASEAGLRILMRGGNAIEAAVAASAALSVVYPHFCGLGGDGVWMLADRAGRSTCLLGIGQAAARLPGDDPIPVRGPLSALTSAGLVASWDAALKHSRRLWGGCEDLGILLEDAIELAGAGFPASPSQRFWLGFRSADHESWPGFQAHFAGGGEQFRQPRLAESLRAIAEGGARTFYEGELAARIARGLADAGSTLTLTDLAATQTREAAPIRMPYRGMTLLAPPPPTQGATTLAIMGILEHLHLTGLDGRGADVLHLCVEAVKQAFLDRHLIADPDFAAVPLDWMLDADHLAAKAAAIDPGAALPWPHVMRTGDTAFIGVVDREGRSVALLQSLYYDWGSGVVAGDTGILWQNRGAAFDRSVDGPNRLQPGKRPFYTLNPGIALRGGMPALVYGTQGADGQPQTLALLLARLIDLGLSPADALAAPRFLLGRTFSDARDTLKLEASAGEATFAELARRGHEVSAIPALSPLAGQAGVIAIDAEGGVTGAHDPRSDGCALGLGDRT